MAIENSFAKLSRRRALALGRNIVGGVVAATTMGSKALHAQSSADDDEGVFKEIEEIIQAEGMFSDGVFSIEIDRDDINNVTLHGVPIKPAFQINGTLYFEKLSDGRFTMNSDIALKSSEIDPFIDQLLAHDIVFQAEHQHFYDFSPIVWFIHFRETGDPIKIAKGVKAALNVTSTPFPQTSPSNPTTPLPADEIGDIIGASPTIGADGVVNLDVPRKNPMILGGIKINPYLNVATSISFEPYGRGQNAAGVIDFGMVAREVDPVVKLMRSLGWDIGCLYNQETDEYPQLYFSHQFKTGDSLQLAREMRAGLDLMYVQFK